MFVDTNFILPSNSGPNGIVQDPFAPIINASAARLRGMLAGKVDINLRGLGGNDSPRPCGQGQIINTRTGECVSACAPGWEWDNYSQRCIRPTDSGRGYMSFGMSGIADSPYNTDGSINFDYYSAESVAARAADADVAVDDPCYVDPVNCGSTVTYTQPGGQDQAKRTPVPTGHPRQFDIGSFFSEPLIPGVPISKGLATAAGVALILISRARRGGKRR